MIRFHETGTETAPPERSSLPEFHAKEASNVSKAEAEKYWDCLFSDMEQKNSISDAEEAVLPSEVFGWSEDEFTFDFEIDEALQSILDKFKGEEWVGKNDKEKAETVKDFADAIAERLKIEDKPSVEFYDGDDGEFGGYDPESNTVKINAGYLYDSEETINTIAHEMRHAYQHERAEHPEIWTDFLYRCNFENYITPIKLDDGRYLYFTDYQEQYVEAEARSFANLFHVNKEAA